MTSSRRPAAQPSTWLEGRHFARENEPTSRVRLSIRQYSVWQNCVYSANSRDRRCRFGQLREHDYRRCSLRFCLDDEQRQGDWEAHGGSQPRQCTANGAKWRNRVVSSLNGMSHGWNWTNMFETFIKYYYRGKNKKTHQNEWKKHI